MKSLKALVVTGLALFALSSQITLQAHCQVPCGIYGDPTRFEILKEHVKTIKKAMTEIENSSTNKNQVARWVLNKEEHASKIIDEAGNYFLAQRIKFDQKDYEESLKLLHQMIVHSMKCKQTTDPTNADKLEKVILDFEKLYNTK
ncbi:MAG: superoxide dismutase [Ni] [Verrucomicrobiota bacterium]